jgi:hypothetical protein
MCCKCLKPGSIPGCVESILMSGIVVNSFHPKRRTVKQNKKGVKGCVGYGPVAKTMSCKCLRPGSIPGFVESCLMSGIVVN